MNGKMNIVSVVLCALLSFSLVALNFTYSNAFYERGEEKTRVARRHDPKGGKAFKSASSSEIDGYMWPDILSADAGEIDYIYFNLHDENYEPVTGIVVNRIDIIQSGKTIISSNDIDSYSVIGEYNTNESAKIINPFSNQNGENIVDIVFYLHDEEVARLNDYTIQVYSDTVVMEIFPNDIAIDRLEIPNELTILNADEDDDVDIWLEDESGSRITSYLEECDSWDDSTSHELNVQSILQLESSKYLDEDAVYNFHVSVNGEEVSFVEEYVSECYVTGYEYCYWYMHPEKSGDIIYEVAGINLMENGPFTLEIEQDGATTGSVNGIEAELDEYGYEVIVEDITGEMATPGDPYTTYLYDESGEMIDESTWLANKDEVEKDIIESLDPSDPEDEEDIDDSDDADDEEQVEEPDDSDEEEIQDPGESEEDAQEGEQEELMTMDKSAYSEVIPAQKTVGTDKVWTIEFSKGVAQHTANEESIYVIDRNTGERVSVEPVAYDSDMDSIVKIYHPGVEYIPGHKYYLVIDGVESGDNEQMDKPVIMEFEAE